MNLILFALFCVFVFLVGAAVVFFLAQLFFWGAVGGLIGIGKEGK